MPSIRLAYTPFDKATVYFGKLLLLCMLIIGIVLVVLGLVLFMVGGALTNNDPGVEKRHLTIIATGFLLILIGGVIATYTVLG